MALTVAQLAAAMRLDDDAVSSDPLQTIVQRLLDVAEAFVAKLAPDAPDDVQDEAAVRIASYLYDQPNAGVRMNYATAWKSSGAMALCAPWRSRRTVIVEDDADGDSLRGDGVNAPAWLRPYLFRMPNAEELERLRADGRLTEENA